MRFPHTLASAFPTLLLAAGLLAPAGAAHAQAMTENFDALGCGLGTQIPAGTGFLNWHNVSCIQGDLRSNSGFNPGATSKPNAAFNYATGDSILTRNGGGPFSLTRGQFTAAWHDEMTVTIVGTRAGTTVATVTLSPTTIPISATEPTLVDLTALINVDTVTIATSGGTLHAGYPPGGIQNFVLDDLQYILGPVSLITVTPPSNGTLSCSPNPVPDGANATCTATPAAGYNLASFTGCTQVGTGNTCTLTNVTAPATVSATFVAAPVVAVPTLNEWALMLLGLGAAGLGALVMRRRG